MSECSLCTATLGLAVLKSFWYTAFKTPTPPPAKNWSAQMEALKVPAVSRSFGTLTWWCAYLSCNSEAGRKRVLFCVGNVRFFKTRLARAAGNLPWPHSWPCSEPEAPETLPTWRILWSYEAKSPGSVCSTNVRLRSYLKAVYHNADDLNHKDILL